MAVVKHAVFNFMGVRKLVGFGMIALLVAGCSNKPRDFDQTFADAKKQSKSAVVRQAAFPLFSLADTNLTPDNLPNQITSLPLFVAEKQELQCWHQSTNALVFMAGGGFKHYGLIICKEQPQLEDANGFKAYIESWGDGVFFFEN